MIITRAAMDAVYNSFRADYEAGMLAVKPMKDRIAMTTRSGGKEETYGWLGNYASMREWLGQKVMNNLVTSGFSIKNRTFENTVTVPREDIEDDRIGVFSGAFKMLGQDAALHPDELIFDLLRNGTQRLCYDGQNFFDTDHPSDPENPSSGSVSNADMATPQGVCHRPAHWSQLVIGTIGPPCDRHIEATSGSAHWSQRRIGIMRPVLF